MGKESCPVRFSFPLDEDRCARTEVFDLSRLNVNPPQVAGDISGFNNFAEGPVVFGRRGLVA